MKFKIFRFNKVKSTNNTAIRIIKHYNCDFGMISSNLQVNGRGQYGKKWVSYKGNLFVSFFYNLKNFKISLTPINFGLSSTITQAFGEIDISQSVNAYRASIVIPGD